MKKVLLLLFCLLLSIYIKALHSDSLDVVHYEIRLDISKFSTKVISGSTRLTIVSKIENLHTFCLDLLKMTIDSVKLNEQLFNTYTYNDTLLIFTPLNTLNPGDTSDLQIFYHGIPKSTNWGGFYFVSGYAWNLGVGMTTNPHVIGRYWYPCLDDFIDRATYDFYITVKPEHKAICGGILKEIINEAEDKHTFHWQLTDPIPTYLSSVAVGNFAAINDTYNGISGNIPIQIWVNPVDSLMAVSTFSKLKQVLLGFEESFGPYRWQRVGYVAVPFSGGAMEHATNITYPRSFLTTSLEAESLYAHELSHHWFGDLITCSNEGDMWINEGWASFCEELFKEKVYGPSMALSHYKSNHKAVLQGAHVDDNGYRALAPMPHEYTYGTTVYKKGAEVVHTLRGYMGDFLFFKSVKELCDSFQMKPISSAELCNFLSQSSGINLTDFFQAWVYSPGFYHFSVDSFKVSPSGGEFKVQVFIHQKLRHAPEFANSNRVELAFMSDNQQFIFKTMSFNGEFGMQEFTVPFHPLTVMSDINQKMSDALFDEIIQITSPGSYSFQDCSFNTVVNQNSDSAWMHISYNWVPPDPLKIPIAGLTLTNYPWWRIEGNIPQNYNAIGRFTYSGNINGTSVVSTDSIILLYRGNPGENWRRIPAVKTGSYGYGTLSTNNFLQVGDYAVGLWNYQAAIYPANQKEEIKIFPNPAKNMLCINYGTTPATSIEIYNSLGKLLIKHALPKTRSNFQIDISTLRNGVYWAQILNQKQVMETCRFVIEK